MNKSQKNRKFFSYSFFKKNSKGFLLAEETLKIIIAVIAIGFLIYLLVSIYLNSRNSASLEQAKATLPAIMNAIKNAQSSVDVYNPKGWIIGTWPHKVDTHILIFPTGNEIEKPQTCTNLGLQTCICICPSDSASSCDNKGICADNTGFLIQGTSISISNPPITLNIDKTNKIISKK